MPSTSQFDCLTSQTTTAGGWAKHNQQEYHQKYLAKGGRFNSPQSAEKGCTDTIRCYG